MFFHAHRLTVALMRHTPQLDGLRAIAILIVMVSHSGLGSIVPGGFGVTIFFFLSGYLITSLLRLENDSTGGVDIRAFYLRRGESDIPSALRYDGVRHSAARIRHSKT
jgi:hypothetical protein